MSICFLINTWGGRRRPDERRLARFNAILAEAREPFRIELADTEAESTALLREAIAEGCTTIFIGGGDGTVHSVVNETRGQALTFAVIPMGTVNALARSLGMPSTPEAALRAALRGKPRGLDVGCINGRLFVCFASIGFDAAVVHSVTEEAKNRMGRMAYALAGLRTFGGQGRDLVRFDYRNGGEHDGNGYSMILSNIRNYAGWNLFPKAHPFSGVLDAVVIRSRSPLVYAGWLGRGAVGLRGAGRGVEEMLVSRMTLNAADRMMLQLDGEPARLGDDRAFEVSVLKGAVQMLVPD